MPKRIQRSRKRGWRMPEGAVYVGRPTKWGNPCDWQDRPDGREGAVAMYRQLLRAKTGADIAEAARQELRGKDLCCWCPLDQPCHADVLLQIANEEPF